MGHGLNKVYLFIDPVRLGENQIAEVFFNEEWVPICGHWFWDNNIGASLFCQQLGFESGSIKERLILPTDGLRVGLCLHGDKWLQCSCCYNCNQLNVGGPCTNGDCTKGQKAAVSIECFGNKPGKHIPRLKGL